MFRCYCHEKEIYSKCFHQTTYRIFKPFSGLDNANFLSTLIKMQLPLKDRQKYITLRIQFTLLRIQFYLDKILKWKKKSTMTLINSLSVTYCRCSKAMNANRYEFRMIRYFYRTYTSSASEWSFNFAKWLLAHSRHSAFSNAHAIVRAVKVSRDPSSTFHPTSEYNLEVNFNVNSCKRSIRWVTLSHYSIQ